MPITELSAVSIISLVRPSLLRNAPSAWRRSTASRAKETNEAIKKIKGASEDDIKNAEETVQKFTDEYSIKIDGLMKKKEVEIMTV